MQPTGAAVATFQQFVPTVYGGDGGSLIDGSLTVSNANRILRRSADGRWGALSTGMVGMPTPRSTEPIGTGGSPMVSLVKSPSPLASKNGSDVLVPVKASSALM